MKRIVFIVDTVGGIISQFQNIEIENHGSPKIV